MGNNKGSKADRRAGTVSVKDDPEREETQVPLEAGSTQPGPDKDEETGSPDKEKLAEDFVEGLSKTGIPLRFMTLDDSERCPVCLISGMMKSKPCETGLDEAPKEYAADKELADCNDGHGDDQFTKPERVEELSDSGDRKIGDGDYHGVGEYFSEANRLNWQKSLYYHLHGAANYKMGRYEEAIEDESKAIDMDPNPFVLYNRAEAYDKTGKDDEALSDLKHALELAREMPIYHDLIPEIHKLVNIIEDKTLNREGRSQSTVKTTTEQQPQGTADKQGKRINIDYFKGYPYLIIRILPAFYHINVLSAEQNSTEGFVQLAQAQAYANKFEVCLVTNEHAGVYFLAKQKPFFSEQIPWGGYILTGKLRLCVDQSPGADLCRREKELETFIESTNPGGYFFGDLTKGGRKASQEELICLQGLQENGLPKGLVICPVCGDYRGECLDPSRFHRGLVVRVSCYCENDNLCAYCGGELHERKLSANRYDPKDGNIWHTPGFSGLSHRCTEVSNNI